MLSPLAIRVVNTLMYPITFDSNPMASIDGAVDFLKESKPSLKKEQVMSALNDALTTSGWSSQVAAMGDHSEEQVKEFLKAARKIIITKF